MADEDKTCVIFKLNIVNDHIKLLFSFCKNGNTNFRITVIWMHDALSCSLSLSLCNSGLFYIYVFSNLCTVL